MGDAVVFSNRRGRRLKPNDCGADILVRVC